MDYFPSELGFQLQLSLIFGVSLLLGFIFQKRFYYKRYNLPPGPFSWPIVGHLPFLPPARHLYYQELAKKYGNIFSLYLGEKLHVVLNGNDLIREALNKESFAGRPPHAFELVPNTPSMGEMNGPIWKEQRQSMLRALREMGMGKTEGAAISARDQSDMVAGFVEKLRISDGQAVKVRDILMRESNNLMFKMIAGETFDQGSEMTRVIEGYQSTVPEYVVATRNKFYYPILRPFITLFDSRVKNGLRQMQELLKVIDLYVSRHEENRGEEEMKDYIDYYLREMNKATFKSSSRQTLLANVFLLIVAGTGTTQSALEWIFATMVQYPDVQKKVYEEILNIIGKERLPEWSDSQFMPYTQAVFWEVMRCVNMIPVNDDRLVLEDDTLGGYDIPKGANILMVFESVHMDPKIWGDPEQFRPERFLSKDVKSLNNLVDNVLVFSKGKRNCPGEGLARMSVFLYFTAVVQAFQILPPKGGLDTKTNDLLAVELDNAIFVFKPRT